MSMAKFIYTAEIKAGGVQRESSSRNKYKGRQPACPLAVDPTNCQTLDSDASPERKEGSLELQLVSKQFMA